MAEWNLFSPSHFFLIFPMETLWDRDPYFLYIRYFKGLVLFFRGRFSKYFRTPKRELLFHRCFDLIVFNCGDRQHVEMGTSMELGGCWPAPRMHIFAVLSSVACCFLLDFQTLCPLCVIGARTACVSSQTKRVRCVSGPCGCLWATFSLMDIQI